MATSSLASRLIKSAGKESLATALSTSSYGDKKVICQTTIPIMRIMMGGSLKGGLTSGIVQVVGDSRTFKTNLCLAAIRDFLNSDPEAIVVFFDCEFGAMKSFATFGIDPERVIHVPFENLEALKFQLTRMLEESKREDKVMFFIDSISQVASRKEAENAIVGNDAADFTRAKEMNSFFRIITPMLNLRDIPLYAINSYYSDMGNKYADPILKGGKQALLSSDAVWFTTRSQEKDADKDLIGWNFNYTILKSRFVREKSKMSLTVTYEGGIDYYSGMFELAEEAGFIVSPTKGFYQRTDKIGYVDERKYRRSEADNPKFWDDIMNHPDFNKFIEDKYLLINQSMDTDKGSYVDLETGEVVQYE